MGFLDRAALATLPVLPRWLMRRLASRYIAGEELGDALRVLDALRARGFTGIIDVLGEDVLDEGAARAVLADYRAAASAVAARKLDAYVSVKPTHLGLRLSEDLCGELYATLAEHCGDLGLELRVEMEDHTTTDATLRVFERLRARHAGVGIVLQSRLLRTPADIARLAPGPLWVRLVKGIYLEPATIAHTEPEPIRAAYVECARLLLERGARLSFATHDEGLAQRLFELCRARGVARQRYELQVLLGVREALWQSWRAAGERVRVYVPYGPEWRAYSTRRLRKNPEIFRHVVRDLLLRR
jgi:proline dehydrogenase